MASISLRHIYKVYERSKSEKKKEKLQNLSPFAVNDFNLEIKDGEFVVIVGPSGCGKSTTLRMIAGLEDISSGELYIGDTLSNNIDVSRRDIAMVFQNYALYPHMTSYQNMSYSLKLRKYKTLDLRRHDGSETLRMIADLFTIFYMIDGAITIVPLIIGALTRKYLEKVEEGKKRKTLLWPILNLIFGNYVASILLFIDFFKSPNVSDEENAKLIGPVLIPDEAKIIALEKKMKKSIIPEEIEECKKEIKELKNKPTVQRTKLVHYTKKEIDDKVQKAAEILDIKHLLGRKPNEMSGGQRQRVALGRALVRDPKVFLLDEPLSNLDAKLRASMRNEIVQLHERVKTTFVYVTHDQIEAMTMGDRIVVMKDGFIQQVGTPSEIYDYPANQFVAGFIGTPQMNFFNVHAKIDSKKLELSLANASSVSFDLKELSEIKEEFLSKKEMDLVLGVRGEHIIIGNKGLDAEITFVELLGNTTNIMSRLASDNKEFAISVPERSSLVKGSNIKVSFLAKNIHLFDTENGNTIFNYKKEEK